MKIKNLILGCILTFSMSFSFGQVNPEGSVVIDPYYGFPNFGVSFVKGFVPENSELKISGVGPCGIRGEYFLSDKFGLGLDFIYNNVSAKGTIDSMNIDGSLYHTYNYKLDFQRYRVHVRMNYHFVNDEKLDAYIGFGAGTNTRRIVVKSDDPQYAKNKVTGALLPVSARIALGMRYYFSPNIGFNAEIGLGGPVLSTGISFRFI